MKARRMIALALALLLALPCAAGAEETLPPPPESAPVETAPVETPQPEVPPEEPTPAPVQVSDVEWCVERGYARPGPDEPFEEGALLSKIQFITMVSRTLGLYDDTGIPFYLAKVSHFQAAADTALFDPLAFPEEAWAKPISRYEAASICYQAMVMFFGYVYDGNHMYVKCAGDLAGIPTDYRPIINAMYSLGIMNGVDEFRTFDGWGTLIGAQGCALVRRMLDPEARVVPVLPTDMGVLFGACTTRYGGGISGYVSPYRENRIFNILRAGETLNEVVVQPGEVFSYNAIVGNAGKAQGYKIASVLKDGEYEYGYGGGICQVSTMVFNAALNANMTIVERYNHGLRSAYVPAGTDATVYYGSLDLKWRNDYGCPVKLVFTHDQKAQTVTLSLYGSEEVYRPTVTTRVVRSKKDPDFYTFTRTADGVDNYSCNSKYNVKKK